MKLEELAAFWEEYREFCKYSADNQEYDSNLVTDFFEWMHNKLTKK